MALTTVTSRLTTPQGYAMPRVRVTASLVASASWLDSPGVGRVVSEAAVKTDADGNWSLDLTPTDAYEVTDAYYQVTEHVPGANVTHAIAVPGSGPVTLRSILITPPTSSGFIPVSVLDDLRDVAVAGVTDGQELVYRASDHAWIPGTPAPDAVTSVAGRTGAVVLAKADVGLAAVDNTADTAKPVSSPQQTALNTAITAHDAATDPHGDRAFAMSRAVALAIVLGG